MTVRGINVCDLNVSSSNLSAVLTAEIFDLSDGVNLIFGPNFSGKSTLVNAIFFALTGKPIVPKVGLPAMAQSGASSGTAGINFRNGEQSYQLFRSTQGEVQLRQKEENDEKWRILFTGKRSADEDLRKQFHFSYHHLAAATFLREGEIFEFSCAAACGSARCAKRVARNRSVDGGASTFH